MFEGCMYVNVMYTAMMTNCVKIIRENFLNTRFKKFQKLLCKQSTYLSNLIHSDIFPTSFFQCFKYIWTVCYVINFNKIDVQSSMWSLIKLSSFVKRIWKSQKVKIIFSFFLFFNFYFNPYNNIIIKRKIIIIIIIWVTHHTK